ncbi:MAG: biotin transporter BioY [Lachnospiraceae bacterium]|jgi:biotin transport system substrate-specific component
MTNKLTKTKRIAYIGICAALIAVCSWISIPLTIPFTLQTFAVFLACGLLGGCDGTIAVVIYVLLGAIGLPVFAGFTGGFGILLSNTGGYIIGFIATALVMWLFEKIFGRKTRVLILSMVLGLLVCYAFGTLWFIKVYSQANGAISVGLALSWCVIPYIIPDLVKIALAFILTKRIRPHILKD